jgi:hypothetical protein
MAGQKGRILPTVGCRVRRAAASVSTPSGTTSCHEGPGWSSQADAARSLSGALTRHPGGDPRTNSHHQTRAVVGSAPPVWLAVRSARSALTGVRLDTVARPRDAWHLADRVEERETHDAVRRRCALHGAYARIEARWLHPRRGQHPLSDTHDHRRERPTRECSGQVRSPPVHMHDTRRHRDACGPRVREEPVEVTADQRVAAPLRCSATCDAMAVHASASPGRKKTEPCSLQLLPSSRQSMTLDSTSNPCAWSATAWSVSVVRSC